MDEKAKLISEYQRLRRVHHSLWVQLNTVDSRLVEIEGKLPDEYTFPGDPPIIDRQSSVDQSRPSGGCGDVGTVGQGVAK